MTEAVIATAGRGEGAGVNSARLRAALAAVGDLIDTSRTDIAAPLAEIPPEFEGSDIDGVILTAGATPIATSEVCALVVRIGHTTAERLWAALQGGPFDLEKIVVREPTPVVARFQDDDLVNADEVAAWGQDLTGEGSLMVIVRPGVEVGPWEDRRRNRLGEVMALPPDHELVEHDVGVDCEAVIVIFEERD
jgi:hypothetical protein